MSIGSAITGAVGSAELGATTGQAIAQIQQAAAASVAISNAQAVGNAATKGADAAANMIK